MSLGTQTKGLLLRLKSLLKSNELPRHGITSALNGNESRIYLKLIRSWPYYKEGCGNTYSGSAASAMWSQLAWAISTLETRDSDGLKTLISHLKNIRDCDEKDKGICYYLSNNSRELFSALCTKWPKYSGDNLYPVPSPYSNLCPSEAFDKLPRWLAGYGRLRRELLDWSITELEKRCG